MSVRWFPCFIDFEASGFGPDSYPIAVAWNDPDSVIHRALINPTFIPTWTHWDDQSQSIHGLSRKRLAEEGLHPVEVARRLTRDLARMRVFSDAPVFDGQWLERLFTASHLPVPFEMDHADELFIGALQKPHEMLFQTQLRLDSLKTELMKTRTAHHDPGYDVGWLVQIWRCTLGEPAKMAHGDGPLPESTPTGSFKRGIKA